MNDVTGPRRFSTASAILPSFHDGLKADDGVKANRYGSIAEPAETESLIGEGTVQDATSVGQETRLLFKYSLPLTLTYLLQVRSNRVGFSG